MPVADTDSQATPDLERKLATILSADVAAYSRLMAEDEEHTLRTFRGHKEVFEKLVGLHRAACSTPPETLSWRSLAVRSKPCAAPPRSRRHCAPATINCPKTGRSCFVSGSISATSWSRARTCLATASTSPH